MDTEERQLKRSLFLKRLYELSQGNERRVIGVAELANSLGYTDSDLEEIRSIVEYLKNENLLKVINRARGGFPVWLSITHKGIVHIEESPTSFMSNKKKRVILFLGANPKNTTRIRIDEELSKIDDGLQAAKYRELFELVSKWAVKMETLTKAMLDHNPQIVHFAGHGEEKGIALEQTDGTAHIVPVDALKSLFRLFKDKVECVVLNACYSEEQAKTISEHKIYVVGMNDSINDKAAIDFAIGFYQSVGAGKGYEFAYQMGRTLLMSKNISQADIPVLWKDGKKIQFEV